MGSQPGETVREQPHGVVTREEFAGLLQFEDLILACERAQRWEFLFIAAPLRIVGGTGSPINPLAVL
jgi:kynurenine formamidase